MTNGEEIRAMTDEALADWLIYIEFTILDKAKRIKEMTLPEIRKDWLDFLRSEVNEND
ncbi:MAG: hypothetical protein II747_07560 [Clostridia bacterium]|nr:hypothetical protein [Clostridia bacterium]